MDKLPNLCIGLISGKFHASEKVLDLNIKLNIEQREVMLLLQGYSVKFHLSQFQNLSCSVSRTLLLKVISSILKSKSRGPVLFFTSFSILVSVQWSNYLHSSFENSKAFENRASMYLGE